jgi:hypothetical protein
MTRLLLIVTALFEVATGVLLLAWPSELLTLVLGPTSVSMGLTGARVAGAVLLMLGVACWFKREAGQLPAGRRLIAILLAYNIAVAAVLAIAGVRYGFAGIALWPVVAAHAALAAWCAASLRS